MRKRLLSLLCVLALTVGLFILPASAEGVTLAAQGWLETICAEISGVTKSQITAVSWTGPTAGSMTSAQSADDQEHGAFSFKYLVRDVDGGVRIDIPGLKAGTYSLTVTAGGQDYTASAIDVKAHDRSGFAHWQHTTDAEGNITGIERYTEGVGAYKDDGTLKDNALVFYVTDDNKDTITITTKDDVRNITVTGIGNMLNSNNSKKNLFLLRAITRDYPTYHDKTPHTAQPVVFRFVGTVTRPAEGLSEPSFALEKNSTTKYDGSNGFMAYMMSARNMTIEGIGDDATIDGWGLSFGADSNDAKEGLARNFELRNLTFRNVPEDCIEIAGREDGTTHKLTCPVEHAWIHNSTFHVPTIPFYTAPAKPDDGTPYTWVDDKREGDGATDVKCAQYVTYAYNHYDSYHKTGLVGGGDDQLTYHLTYHHNYYYNVDQRCPLARQADIHLYNNVYEKQRGYCVSLRANTYVFSEYNTFLNCKNPVKNEGTGGVCKSYNDSFDASCSGNKDVTAVSDRDDPVAGKNPYAGFELSAELSYIPDGGYLLEEDTDDAQTVVAAWTGAMKPLEDITSPEVHHHVWGEWTVESPTTCTAGGHRYRYCQDLDDCPLENGLDDQETAAKGHRFVAGACARCGCIDTTVRYTMNVSDLGEMFSRTGSAAVNGNSIKTGGSLPNNALVMTLPTAATVKVTWANGSSTASRAFHILGADKKTAVYTSAEAPAKGGGTFETDLAAGTYYLGSTGGTVSISAVEVSSEKPKVLDNKTLGDSDELTWSCTGDGTLNVAGYIPENNMVLAALWKGTRFLGVRLIDANHMGAETGENWDSIRLFWVNGQQAPQCQAGQKEPRPAGN